jgi:hypothetical protein
VGSGQGFSSSSTKEDAKVLGPSLGLASKWTGSSFAEVLCSVPISAVKRLPFVGDLHSGLRASSEELGALDPLLASTHAEQVLSSVVGCPLDPLVKDRSLDLLGKKPPPRSNSNFECSMMHTWSKLVNGLKVVLGRAIRNCLGRLVGSGLGKKRSGFRLAQLLPKPKAHTTTEPGTLPFPAPSRPEPSSSAVPGALPVGSSSSGFSLVRPPPRGLEVVSSGKGIAVPGASFAFPAPSLRLAVPGAFPVRSSSSWGGSSSLKVDPSRVTASMPSGASLAVSQPTASPFSGVTELGEKLRSSPPVVSKPFQSYMRKARVLREGVSLKWNDVLLSDSLKALKMVAVLAVNKASVAEPPTKKVAEPLVKDFLRKGFLNPRPDLPTTSSSPRKVFDGGIVGPSSPPRGCSSSSPIEGNGFSQSRNWPIGFDHNGEIVV